MRISSPFPWLSSGGVPQWARHAVFQELTVRDRFQLFGSAHRRARRLPGYWLAWASCIALAPGGIALVNVVHLSRSSFVCLVLALLAAATVLLGIAANYYRLSMLQELAERFPHLCRGCGYDLRATLDRCPECGRMVDSADGAPTV